MKCWCHKIFQLRLPKNKKKINRKYKNTAETKWNCCIFFFAKLICIKYLKNGLTSIHFSTMKVICIKYLKNGLTSIHFPASEVICIKYLNNDLTYLNGMEMFLRHNWQHKYTHKHTHNNTHTRTHTHSYIRTLACTHTQRHTHMYAHSHVHTNKHTLIRTHTRTYTHTNTHSYVCTFARTHTQTHTHTYAHSHVCTLARTHTHTHTYAHSHIRTLAHTHTHATQGFGNIAVVLFWGEGIACWEIFSLGTFGGPVRTEFLVEAFTASSTRGVCGSKRRVCRPSTFCTARLSKCLLGDRHPTWPSARPSALAGRLCLVASPAAPLQTAASALS